VDYGYIREYDPQTGKAKKITHLKEECLSILVHNDVIYYSYCVDTNLEGGCKLFCIKTNGKGKKLYAPIDAWDYSFYNNKIYYTGGASDMPPIYVYDFNTKKNNKICLSSSQYDPFRISKDKLYYGNFEDDFIGCININTGKTKKIIDGPSNFTLLGQYLFYVDTESLYAYDVNTEKSYNLMVIGNYDFQLYATTKSAYIVFFKDSSNELNRIVLSNGKASLEKVVELSNKGCTPS
jgi:hypothetical protein